jgi:hypothetical protein
VALIQNPEESSSGNKQKTKIDKRSSFDIHFAEEQKQNELNKQKRLFEQQMRPFVNILFEAIDNREDLNGIFVKWGQSIGFTNQKWAETVEALIFEQLAIDRELIDKEAYYEEVVEQSIIKRESQRKLIISTIVNQWLNQFEGCNSKLRGSKIKKTKLQFEKKAPSKKDIEKQLEVKSKIERFKRRMEILNNK